MKKLVALFLAAALMMALTPALAECSHVWEVVESKPSTCREPGWSLSVCRLCEDKLEEKLPLADHAWVYDRYDAPTCMKEGYYVRYCPICETKEDGKLIKGPHTWVFEKYEASTCEKYGYYYKYCSVCKAWEDGKLELGPHTWHYESDVLPTCTVPGYYSRICTVCKLHEEEKLDALGHVPGDWIITREPTHNRDGERVILCTVCSVLLKLEPIPALGWTNHPAAPAIAAHLLKAAGIAPNYDTGLTDKRGNPVYENYIAQVAARMGPGTDFNGVEKTQDPEYTAVVRNFLISLGAGL